MRTRELIIILFVTVVVGGGLIFGFAFSMAAAFPDAHARCNKALPDAHIISSESIGHKILCRTVAEGAAAEVWVWLDGDGKILETP